MAPLPLVLDEAAVVRLLAGVDVAAVLRRMFQELSDASAVQPPQSLTLFPGEAGDFITYQGALAGAGVFGAKLSPYIQRPGGGLVTAWTVLLSMTTGQPLLLCDSRRLTTERTAATTALAVDLLAPEGAARLAIIGAGAVGLAHLRHVRGLRPWTDIRLWSPGLAARLDGPLAEMVAADDRLAAAGSLADALDGAEVILLCTSSAGPVIGPAMVDAPALITSISTNAPQAHEIEPAWLADLDVYADDRATTPAVAGEMRLAAQAGLWSPGRLCGDLAELVSGRAARPAPGRCAFFRSVGLGLEDIALAAAIHAAAVS